jgi:hypothetical protein
VNTSVLPSCICPLIQEPLTVDGDLVHKQVWQRAAVSALLPVTGLPMPNTAHDNLLPPHGILNPTTLRVYWNASHICVAFLCVDQDIWGTYTERDDPLYDEEVVEVFFSPTGDVRHYYEFEVSPRNAIFDARVYSPDLHRGTMQVDTSWDCPGLQTAVKVHGTVHHEPPDTRRLTPNTTCGWWMVEMAIPFAAFPEVSPPEPGDVWRANFYRIDRADPPEFTAWSPTLEQPANFHVPERFGHLVFEGGG